MVGTGMGSTVVGIQRAEMSTRDMDVIAELINQQYVQHRATFHYTDLSRVDAGARSVIADPLEGNPQCWWHSMTRACAG